MRLGEADDSGRRRPIPIQGSEFSTEVDTVIPAVGQAPDLSFLPPDSKLERTRWEMLSVDPDNLATNVPGVFAGGDFVTGPAFVITAIAAGRRGAVAIDKYLCGDTSRVELYDVREAAPPTDEKVDDLQEDLGEKPRVIMPVRAPKKRVSSFEEIEIGFSEDQAREEAKRCLRCDLEQ
jgi:NADH-quinone oxidoreductase subunit F